MNASNGIVYFVGAGPGAPGLLTLRGAECLRRAEVVLYDYLVNPQVLRHANRSAELICLGRHGRATVWSQDAINKKLVQEAKHGKTVVRLKGGDPMVFGRAAEEIGSVASESIPFEVVPGVTAALASAAYTGIPITDRNHASAIAFVTGQENPSKSTSTIDYGALARFPGTLVFYMSITTSPQWTRRLIEEGMSPDTPVTVVRRCSWPDQRLIRCRLGELPDKVTPYSKFPPPAVAIVGEVNHDMTKSWFQSLPLFGLTVLVTRPKHQAHEMAESFRELGAHVLLQPAIRIENPEEWEEVDNAIERLDSFDWIVFTSSNAVHRFLGRLEACGRDLRALGSTKLAAVGVRTEAALAEYHLRVDARPHECFRSEDLLAALAPAAKGQRFLMPQANRSRELLAKGLADAGGLVETIAVYQHQDEHDVTPEVADLLAKSRLDWVVITSPASAKALQNLLGSSLEHASVATISPLTTQAAQELGMRVGAEATVATTEGIVQAVVDAVTDQR